MGRKKLTEEEKAISKEKRKEYLKNYQKEHGHDYYMKNKKRINKQQRERREKKKGEPLNAYNKIDYNKMSKKEKNAYHSQKMRECRARKKEKQKNAIENASNDNVIAKVNSIEHLHTKSLMKFGNIKVYNTKHYNWLQKKIWKLFLGVEIKDYEEKKGKK